jgi:hypothetical protein
MDIQAIRERGEAPGHKPWEETIAALEEIEGRLTVGAGDVETLRAEVADLRESHDAFQRRLAELESRNAAAVAAPAVEKNEKGEGTV